MEALLRVKSNLLDAAEQTLRNLLNEKKSLEDEVQRLISESDRHADDLTRQTEILGATIMCYANHQAHTRNSIEQLRQNISGVETRIRDQRETVQVLRGEAKLIDRVRDRAYRDWLKEVDKEIEQLGTESYLSRLVRQQSEHDVARD